MYILELISCLFVVEQNNELLMKYYEDYHISCTLFSQVNAMIGNYYYAYDNLMIEVVVVIMVVDMIMKEVLRILFFHQKWKNNVKNIWLPRWWQECQEIILSYYVLEFMISKMFYIPYVLFATKPYVNFSKTINVLLRLLSFKYIFLHFLLFLSRIIKFSII